MFTYKISKTTKIRFQEHIVIYVKNYSVKVRLKPLIFFFFIDILKNVKESNIFADMNLNKPD